MMRSPESSGSRGLWIATATIALSCIPFYAIARECFLLWMRTERVLLGGLSKGYLVPVHARWDPHLDAWLLPALAAYALFLGAAAPRIMSASPRATMLLGMAAFVLLTPATSMIDAFPAYRGERHAAIVLPLARTKLEYIADVPHVERVGGPKAFLEKYAKPRLYEQLSLHSRTHPPGGALFLWAVSKLLGPGVWIAAFAIILVGAFSAPLVFLIAREICSEGVARAALILFLVTPNVVLYGATSMDSVFAAAAMLPLFAFLRSQRAGISWPSLLAWGALSGLALGAAAFMTYAVVVLVLFYAIQLLRKGRDRERFLRAAAAHGIGLVAFAAFYAGLFAWAGYDPFEAARAATAHDAEMVGTGHESWSRFFVLGAANLLAFCGGVGFPTLGLWLARAAREPREWLRDAIAPGLALTVLVSSFSTLFTLEVERVWLFLMPIVVAPAAAWITEADRGSNRPQVLPWFAVALAATTLLIEILLEIPW